MRSLAEWGKECHEGMQAKGFRRTPISVLDGAAAAGELMLVVSELAEAMEELRQPGVREVYYSEGGKPEGIGPELADATLRLLGLCHAWGIDIEKFMEEKNAYNKTRTMGHGGKKF